jgi:signal transduction histidine kinase
MELRQLRHFLALVEERSITRAARRELIVQSGLSNSLQALERELGTPLYVRGTRPVRLTAAGEALVGPARRTLASAAQAEQAVQHTRDVLIGTLRLGVSLSAQHLVPFASYLGEFTRDHPGIDLRLQYAPALTMISMVGTGELDCVIGPAVSQVPGVRMTRLAGEPLHLVCRADHRLAQQAKVNLRQLAGERFVEAAAARPIVKADQMRTVLLTTVSHDLRTPLAAAKAAVSCLRSDDVQLTAEDHGDLLATADESLNQLTQLLGNLLDVSRLQAGALPVFPRAADLEEIIARCLGGIGPQDQAVMVSLPSGLPRVMVDPPIMERVVANLTANALRYSPSGSPPLLTASARGGKVILRVVDHGPGVPEADRDRIFAAFQRLGDARSAIGVGLGLTVSRGLTEAMGGTLEPEETSGGGLTMAISVPIATRPRSVLHRTASSRPARPPLATTIPAPQSARSS